MRDNPMHIALYGQDPHRRERAITRMFTGFFRMFKAQTPLVAVEGGTIVGVTGVAPPGTCQANFVQQLRAVPTALMLGPRSAAHMVKVVGDWRKRLYQRVGYAVIDEADVIGVHCWFMRRSAHPT